MMLPTLSGVVGAPLKALTAVEGDTFTAQEFVDGVFGAAAMGYLGASFRFKAVVRKIGTPALVEKYNSSLIVGII